ncbi:MAG: PEGA domain-containing protein [Candidatus Komeilibacteria bacterium]|nr:PEGA domain-containing protein [Candidatus Komeilibacteria bacterium]
MNLRARRLLYISCIIIFLLAAPWLVLYTAGYRYDWEYRRLVETGSLVVNSNPIGASVYLNGQIYNKVTPTIINDIPPGKINLEVKKDGFYDWQRNVNVTPRVTTFVEDIKLFLQSTPQLLLAGPITDYWWNHKQDKIAYINPSGELRLYNTLNKKDGLLMAATRATNKTVIWSPQDDRLIFSRGLSGNLAHFIINPDQPEKAVNLSSTLNRNFEQIQWDTNSTDTLYGLSRGALYRIPFLLKTARLVQAGPIVNFTSFKDKIIILAKAVGKRPAVVSSFAIADPSALNPITTRLDPVNDIFINTNSEQIAIYNTAQKTLTIIKESNINIPNVGQVIWSKDGSRLVYTSTGAIYRRTITEPVSELITRYSQNITNVLWASDESYIFYTVNDSLRVLEIEAATTPRVLILVESLPQAKNTALVNQPPILTYIDENGQLMSLPLAPEERGTFLFGGQ